MACLKPRSCHQGRGRGVFVAAAPQRPAASSQRIQQASPSSAAFVRGGGAERRTSSLGHFVTFSGTRRQRCVAWSCTTMDVHARRRQPSRASGAEWRAGGCSSPPLLSSPPLHGAIRCTSSPSWQSVKCSSPGQGPLTQIAGSQPRSSPLQTLGPFIQAAAPPPCHPQWHCLPRRGGGGGRLPHNDSGATVADISMPLMFRVFFAARFS